MKYVALALAFILFTSETFAADEGKPAPDLKAKVFSGDDFSLKASIGQVVLVHFWATWCVPCQKEMPALESYYKQHHGEGLRVLAISMDAAKDEAKVREEMKRYSFPGVMSKDASTKEYGRIWRLPMTFVIDRRGILRKDGWDGERGIDLASLEKTIGPLLKEPR